MSHILRVGQADQIAYFRAYNTDGSGKTDLTSATTGLTLSVFRIGASSVSISSLSNKAADNTAHADGAIRAVGGNLYTIDLPDAATATQVPSIAVRGTYTGGVVEGLEHPIVAYDPSVVAVGANTTTPPTAAANATAVRSELATELARIDVNLSSLLSTTHYDNSLTVQPYSIVERSTNDTNSITFSWPVSGATITGEKSINNGAYSAVAGAITFLRTESNRHYYALAYNASDRATTESSVRYKMTDGTYTKYFNLHVVPSGDVNVTLAPLAADQEPRNTRTRIIVYTGEGGTQYFYARDSQGNNLVLTGFNLELRFARGKSVIYTARTSDGSLSISNGNQVTFTRSTAITRGDGELTYALRDMGSGAEVLLEGPVTVRYAP